MEKNQPHHKEWLRTLAYQTDANMSEYWDGLMKYDTPMHGQKHIAEVREQIQEDIITYFGNVDLPNHKHVDDLCQIVVDNFRTLE